MRIKRRRAFGDAAGGPADRNRHRAGIQDIVDPGEATAKTANAQLKPATLETGLVVQVPPFISPGDKIRVNTETGEYQSRA